MKKLLSYILILVVLVGFFGTTNAQSPTKPCLLPDKTTVTMSQADCLIANGTWDPQTTTEDKTYHYLAPLPGVGETFDPTQTGNLGAYLNIMINLFIGICAVLAVIMIVMGGLEYMTSELISSKEHGRERITGAIFGLILALGAWTLLYTINPDLLNTELSSLQNVEVIVTVDESPATAVSAGSTEISAGMTKASGIVVNNSIAAGVNNLMAKAKADGIPLAGGGFRSKATQTQLRIKNCHGDTTNPKPNPPCNPPTAVPGNSMHESGQAIDFTCAGELIQAKDNRCFIWLSTNAKIAGLINFSKEPWHWSTNGK